MKRKWLTPVLVGFSAILIFLGQVATFEVSAATPISALTLLSLSAAVSEEATPSSPALFEVVSQDIQVMAGSDLIVDSITYSPINPQIGQETTITVTIKNLGSTAEAPGEVRLYVTTSNQPPTTTTTYAARTYNGIPLTVGVPFIWSKTNTNFFGANDQYYIYAWVDQTGLVAEADETNNILSTTVSVGSISGDIYEEDDTCQQAKDISTDGAAQSHNLSPAPDEDWVKFSAINGITYRVKAVAIGTDVQNQLEVELLSRCDGSPSFGSNDEFVFTASADGIYYAKVKHTNNSYGPNTAYNLAVTAQSSCTGKFEPNNSCATAGDFVIGDGPQTHSFCQANDRDWIKFPVQAGASYQINSTDVGSQARTELGLYMSCDATEAADTGQSIQFTSPTAGIVYIQAKNENGNIYGNNTDYTLKVAQLGTGCENDGFEEDDTAGSAKTIIINGPAQTHNICPAQDTDWGQFQATAGVTYTLETFNLGSYADTHLALYDASGNTLLAVNDDGGAGKASRIVWVAPSSGVYTVRVRDFDQAVAGADTRYDLHILSGLCTQDTFEDDDTRNTARPTASDGTLQTHNICPKGDEDWVAFTVNSGPYVMETTNLRVGADTIIELYNADGNRLAINDDYDSGTASRIAYTFTSAATYYFRVRPYNSTRYGTGSEYALRVYPGTPTVVPPSPTPPPTATPTPPAPPSQVQTLILVNRNRIAALYGDTQANQLLTKLDQLANHDQVRGEVIRLDNNTTVNAAYADWTANLTNVDRANQVTAAVRGVIMTYLQQYGGVEYIVLVGDDQLLPFRRVADNTPRSDSLERDYNLINPGHSVGAALRANNFLTDDYYADRDPVSFQNRELYIPDLAIGRLVETPAEIITFIDSFLANPTTTVGKALVTGYDFVIDTAQANCQDWQADLGNTNLDCMLIGENWALNEYKNRQLNANPPFKLQSINGHANHAREGAPGFNNAITGSEIAASASDLSGGLIYTLGCHSGLNVPASNTVFDPLDLPQAFAQKKANYVGNTGYGWGLRSGVGLSEAIMRLFTEELRRDNQVFMGQALIRAKQRYYQEENGFNGYNEKVMEELIFYGLPMYRLQTGSSLAAASFGSVHFISSLPGTFGDETVISGTASIDLVGSLGPDETMSRVIIDDGTFYTLDGFSHMVPGQPVQPLFFGNVSAAGWTARSVLFRAGNYETLTGFNPLIASPVNDDLPQTTELPFTEALSWYPVAPPGLQTNNGQSSLVVQMGQYNLTGQQARLYDNIEVDIYYSLSADQEPPLITVADSLYYPHAQQAQFKVGAIDVSGIQRVTITYTDGGQQGQGIWRSMELQFDAASQKWTGSLPVLAAGLQYMVQVVDRAGNLRRIPDKDGYLSPALAISHAGSGINNSIYLPIIIK